MKHHEFYRKYKIRYRSSVRPIFSKKNWWHTALILLVGVLIEPLIMYKRHRSIPFSLHYYVTIVEYCLLLVIPFGVFLYWSNRQELIKRSRSYILVGKFEVVQKQSLLIVNYLLLAPGKNNRLMVDRALFNKIHIGDFITIRRDSLGSIKEVNRINRFSNQLTKARVRQFIKQPESY